MGIKKQKLSVWERRVRDNFVKEFVRDRNYLAAVYRLGFSGEQAKECVATFKRDSYVQNKIMEIKEATQDVSKDREEVLKSLWLEAEYHGPDASHSARVSALSKIAIILGLEAPSKVESQVNHTGAINATVNFEEMNMNDAQLEATRQYLKTMIEAKNGSN